MKRQIVDLLEVNCVILSLPKVTCQRVNSRLYNNISPKVDCKQSYII